MAYTRPWQASQPGCMIFVLDQSGSMADAFGQSQAGAGKLKADVVATILNGFLDELIQTNTVGNDVRPRADIAVLGYNGSNVGSALQKSLAGKTFVTLGELKQEPLNVSMRERDEVDDTGRIVKIPVYFPEWVAPVSSGGTPMCAALAQAESLAAQWAASHRDSYPPVIINVTDGMSTDGDPVQIAERIKQIQTNDGQALLFNCHITSDAYKPVRFPASEADVPPDQYARLLFQMSSPLPDEARKQILATTKEQLPAGARGFIFNGDAVSIKQMFVFASIARTVPLNDPTR